MIKNLVFDLGGVILTDEDIGFLFDNEEIVSKLGVSNIQLEKAWDDLWHQAGEGYVNQVDFYNKLQEKVVGKSDPTLTKFIINLYESRTRALDPYYLLPKLKENYKIFALTNMTDWGLKFKKDKFQLDKYFDLVVSSNEEKISKPDPKIFNTLIKRGNVIPSESLYVDDREKNTKTASEFGFVTYLYKNYENFKDELNKLEIKYE